MKKILASRAFRQGSVATAVTVIVVALAVVLNMIVSTLSERYALSIDLTEDKIFALSQDSIDFLAGLEKDATIYVLNTEANFTAGGDYFVQANEVIKKYAQQSPHVKVEYIDFVRNPNFSSRYPDLQLATSSILVTCGDKTVDLTPYDLYNIQSDPYYGSQQITSSKAEQTMTSALLNVTSDKKIGAVMLSGHNEQPLSQLGSNLEMNNYEVKEQNLLTEEIDPEATIAILNAPTRDLEEAELKKLDTFLAGGGKKGKTLLYFASADQADLPNLAAFLADWGIKVGDSFVFENSGNRVLGMNLLMPVVDYTENTYAKVVIERNLYTVIPYARPLETLFDSKNSITVTSPLEFSATSGVIPPDAPSNWQPGQSDLSGPIPALIVAQNLGYEGTTPQRSNVVVCGSEMAASDAVLTQTSVGNSEYFLTLIDTLCEREDIIRIQSKTIGGKELGAEAQMHVGMLTLVLVILLPLATLITGIVIWMRRRHR